MMFNVVWKPAAERSLATIWTEADDRQRITDAARAVDRTPQNAPLTAGESRSGDLRILFERPLGIEFHVNKSDRVVSVLRVFRFRSKSAGS